MRAGADPLRVLVVDDNAAVAQAVAAVLRQLGVSVKTADSVATAVPLLRGFRPELVITDISMPAGSGFEMLAEVHRWSATTPVVALTAASDVGRVEAAVFFRVLRKPVSSEQLAELVTLLEE